MVGLATITFSTSSVRAEETTAQSSYPLKSEKAIPLGVTSAYLSCAEIAAPVRTISIAATVAIMSSFFRRFMTCPFLFAPDLFDDSNVTIRADGDQLAASTMAW